jgi:CRP-like cAMP-binding protein
MPTIINHLHASCSASETAMDALLRETAGRAAQYRDREHLLFAGDLADRCHLLTHGFAARCFVMRDGRRQISALYICGDFIDLQCFEDRASPESLIAIGPCATKAFRNEDVRRARRQSPDVSDGLLKLAERNGLIARAWIASLGRRDASQHLAHLVCELLIRARAAGATMDHEFFFPARQEHLADILGLSNVHLNRVLQALKRTGLISWDRNVLRILDFRRLSELADFDAAYLDHGGLGVPSKSSRH